VLRRGSKKREEDIIRFVAGGGRSTRLSTLIGAGLYKRGKRKAKLLARSIKGGERRPLAGEKKEEKRKTLGKGKGKGLMP